MGDIKKEIIILIKKINIKIEERYKLVEEKNELTEKLLKEELVFEDSKAKKLLETDFKKLFKKDNDDIRKSFIRKECKNNIKNIDEIKNKIEINKNNINQIDIEIKTDKNILNVLNDLWGIENGKIQED